ncbi:MAG: hypothetical protein J5855_03750 [Mailhella sp.]|nr:hypothetical protein [Mailhella sp.]
MFYTLYQFMVYTKSITYLLMGLTLILFVGFFRFLTARDKQSGRPDNWEDLKF